MDVCVGGARVEKAAPSARSPVGALCAPRRWISHAAMSPSARASAGALTLTLGLAAAGWVVALRQMDGMNMGVATPLGSFSPFVALWVPMMAAMMLPGAVPAVVKCARAGKPLRTVPLFVGSYLAVWAIVGVAVYALYRPHGVFAAGVIALAAGAYELTALKARFRRRCHAGVGSGVAFGRDCVGTCLGLMLVQVALGIMNISWMAALSVVVLLQKLLPPKAAIDIPFAFAIIGLGIVTLLAPSSVLGFTPAMCGAR
jgi:predicted metal-binding membrane protein